MESQSTKSQIHSLLAATQKILPRRIQFNPAKQPDKIAHVNIVAEKPAPSIANKTTKKGSHVDESGFVYPPYELSSDTKIVELLRWKKTGKVGGGLVNLGNTCFLNSVLQCLTHTPALANYCLAREHNKNCRTTGFCFFCVLENHIVKALGQPATISPKAIVSNLKSISKTLRVGRQEDSHEFLRYLTDALQKNCIAGLQKLDTRVAETSAINKMFGGYLQSQVKCLDCSYTSNTFEFFLDLSLEIKSCNSLDKALQRFTSVEKLDKDNKYKCPKCAKYVLAQKRFSIKKPPHVLTVQLKRFNFHSLFGGKISKPVDFPEVLDLKPYLSNNNDKWNTFTKYDLHGIVVHHGSSLGGGHYVGYVKSPSGVWHCMNDSHVSQVSVKNVLSQSAYILFYSRVFDPKMLEADSPITSSATPSSKEEIPTPEKIIPEKLSNNNHKDNNNISKSKLQNGHSNGTSVTPKKTLKTQNGTSNGTSTTPNNHTNGNSKANGHQMNGNHQNGNHSNGNHSNGTSSSTNGNSMKRKEVGEKRELEVDELDQIFASVGASKKQKPQNNNNNNTPKMLDLYMNSNGKKQNQQNGNHQNNNVLKTLAEQLEESNEENSKKVLDKLQPSKTVEKNPSNQTEVAQLKSILKNAPTKSALKRPLLEDENSLFVKINQNTSSNGQGEQDSTNNNNKNGAMEALNELGKRELFEDKELSWEGLEQTANSRNELLKNDPLKYITKERDEYDADYDKGRSKKVKDRETILLKKQREREMSQKFNEIGEKKGERRMKRLMRQQNRNNSLRNPNDRLREKMKTSRKF